MQFPITNLSLEKKYGLTDPISKSHPNEIDKKENVTLNNILLKNGLVESIEDKETYENILNDLYDIFIQWVKDTLKEQGRTVIDLESVALIYTFGSYRLGAHSKGADIDILFVGPKYIDHDMFFNSLCLEVLAKHSSIKDLTIVPNAFVPLAKFTINNINIDLIYGQVPIGVLTDKFNILNDEVMHAVNPQTMRSLNGARDTDTILDLVPNQTSFCNALKFIKLWAKKRAVYGNVIGFPGGVAYAIMTARICQLYPNANSAMVVKNFFNVYNIWKWPKPVCINVIKPKGPGEHPVWSSDSNVYDRMPIITPAYPAQNSTFNITNSNFLLIKEEIERGKKLISSEEENIEKTFNNLITESEFFIKHKHYFELICSHTKDENYKAWFGWIESRLRKLIVLLEDLECLRPIPYPRSFDILGDNGLMEKYFYIGLKIVSDSSSKNNKKKIDVTPIIKRFISHALQGNTTNKGTLKVKYISRKMLPEFVFNKTKRSDEKLGNKKLKLI